MTFPLSAPIPFPYFHTCIFPHFHISTLKIFPAIFRHNANFPTQSPTESAATASSTARPHGGRAGLRARPIGHWQHWNWQHFHIGNILTAPQKLSRAWPCAAARYLVHYPPTKTAMSESPGCGKLSCLWRGAILAIVFRRQEP